MRTNLFCAIIEDSGLDLITVKMIKFKHRYTLLGMFYLVFFFAK